MIEGDHEGVRVHMTGCQAARILTKEIKKWELLIHKGHLEKGGGDRQELLSEKEVEQKGICW